MRARPNDREIGAEARPRIGLVLGGGGTSGAAFHAGTLLALAHDLGWDARAADLIVGTSAGSIVGALLRSGLDADDLAAWGASASAKSSGLAGRRLLDELEASRQRIVPSPLRMSLPSVAMLRGLRRPTRLGVRSAALTLLPHGWIDAAPALGRIGELVDGWPSEALWITAVGASDARRVVFGRDAMVPLGRAIAASCAIPAVFRPVRIDGHRYVDGGVHSATNADLLIDAGVDAAIIVSPMSAGDGARGRRPDHVLRAMAHRRVRAEQNQLEAAGIEVQLFEPDAQAVRTMGLNVLDRGRTPAVVRDAFLAAGATIADQPRLRRLLEHTVGPAMVADRRCG